jgi:hypothetical protein
LAVESVPVPDSLRLTSPQRARLKARERDHERTVAAMYRLERAAGAPAPGRGDAWRLDVVGALASLENAVSEEQTNANRPDSLLSELLRAQPGLRGPVRELRVQHDQERQAIAWLRREIVQHTYSDADHIDLRRQVASLLSALRYEQAREADLVYEALVTSAV